MGEGFSATANDPQNNQDVFCGIKISVERAGASWLCHVFFGVTPRAQLTLKSERSWADTKSALTRKFPSADIKKQI